jgi:hydrophobe/amphiphile efflux-1 (HAE1) family protein
MSKQNLAQEDLHRENDLASLAIRRPILVLVLNLLIALAGIAAIMAVEVRELPDVDRPIVSVFGVYPGASPETIDAEVTSIIEGAVARVSGVTNIFASSEENNFRVHVEFSPGADLNSCASDVREAVDRITRELPDEIENLSVIKADNDAQPIINIAVISEQLADESLALIVEKDIIPSLISIDGVADVQQFGQRKRVLRVVFDPMRLASFNLSVSDVVNVLKDAPFDVPAGSFRSDDQELLVRADASVVTEQQVKDIIIRGTTNIGDVAHVVFGPEDAESLGYLDKRPVLGLGIIRQAQSNTIDISNAVHKAVKQINKRFNNLQVVITEDRATFIRGSVYEVIVSLSFTALIVIATIWLFLGSMHATLIPGITIPIALIGTIAAIWLMGFSINVLTLLAIVLATGLVVDDAIVVLENIQRRRGHGLGPRAAAVLGTRQVFFAVVTTTAVLVAVFVPIAFLPSTAGRLFREFGLVLASAVAISSFIALSLVPAMAVRLLTEPDKENNPGKRYSNGLVSRLRIIGGFFVRHYDRSIHLVLSWPRVTVLVSLVVAVVALMIYQFLGQELLPTEDRGVIYVDATGPDGVGLTYMERQAERMEKVLQPFVEKGEIVSLFTMVGNWDPNRARVVAPLAHWDMRKRDQQAIINDIREPMNNIPGANMRVSSSNSLNLRGRVGEIQVALLGNEYPAIYTATRNLALAIEEELPNLSEPRISYRPTQAQLSIGIDRLRAADLDIPLANIEATLRAVVAGEDVVDLRVSDEAIPIILESSSTHIDDPGDLINLYVSTRDGRLLPLSSVVTLREESVAAELDRHAQRRAIEIDAALAPGYPLAAAAADLSRLAAEILPEDVSMVFLGEAQTLDETTREVFFTYIIALIIVFLVLCAQFENIVSAVIVMLVVPFGLAAAVYALFLTGTSINIYSQIGLVMLIGLMAKNGILLVEFADQMRDQGKSVYDAIVMATQVRVRPITMTMLSTVLGSLPLILSSGPGAEARGSIGWVIFGGLGLAAFFTLYLTPVIYLVLSGFHRPRAVEGQLLVEELQQAALLNDAGKV